MPPPKQIVTSPKVSDLHTVKSNASNEHLGTQHELEDQDGHIVCADHGLVDEVCKGRGTVINTWALNIGLVDTA
jgi:hypothetical protein